MRLETRVGKAAAARRWASLLCLVNIHLNWVLSPVVEDIVF